MVDFLSLPHISPENPEYEHYNTILSHYLAVAKSINTQFIAQTLADSLLSFVLLIFSIALNFFFGILDDLFPNMYYETVGLLVMLIGLTLSVILETIFIIRELRHRNKLLEKAESWFETEMNMMPEKITGKAMQ